MSLCADQDRGTGVLTPLPPGKSENIGFHSNTGPDPLKNHNGSFSSFYLGLHYLPFRMSFWILQVTT